MSGADSNVIDGFFSVLTTVIFLAANGHHAVLIALAHTFDLAPIGGSTLPAVNPVQVMALIQAVFVVALRIVMPVLGALLLTDVAMGFVGKAAPQMQIMVVGAPVKILIGLLFLAASTPTTVMLIDAVSRGVGTSVTSLLGG
jgi:flagellar biosynthetic protein FliR